MEIKTKDIIIYGAAAIGVYFIYSKFLKKKGPAASTATNAVKGASVPAKVVIPATTTTPPVVKYTYPMGIAKDGSPVTLNEGDYVADGTETAILFNGQLRPITAAYANKYTVGTWDRTKILDEVSYRSIPRGAVLDA
jgi:hypothetical protein